MGVGSVLDLVALIALPVEERVQPVPATPERIDLSHVPEYRKRQCLQSGYGASRSYWVVYRGQVDRVLLAKRVVVPAAEAEESEG